MGWGAAFGEFFNGYQKTMAQRHGQREEQFKNLMDVAQKWREVAENERAKPIWNPNSQTVITEAETNAHKAVMDAEKAMNQKIGGLTKLGGLIQGLIKNKQAAAGQQPGGEGQTPAAGGESNIQSPAQEGPPPSLGAASETTPPPNTIPVPGPVSTMTAENPSGLPAPPSPMNAPAAAPTATMPGLRPGQFINPAITAKQQIDLDAEKRKIETLGPIQLNQKLAESKQVYEQTQKLREEEFNKYIPALKAAGKSDEKIAEVRLAYMTGMKNAFGTPIKPIIDQQPFKGPDGKWRKHVYNYDEDTGQYVPGTPIETGPPTTVSTLSAKMDEKVKNYMAAHPEVTDTDAVILAIRKNEQKILDNKLKSSNFKVVSDSALAEYRTDRTKFLKEAQVAKAAGKDMTPQQAMSVLNHADAMARVDLGSDLDGMEADEAHMALLAQSNLWLQNNVGLSRNELREIIKRKPASTQKPAERTAAAARNLLNPPETKPKPSVKKY
jgi:hypothetical protein